MSHSFPQHWAHVKRLLQSFGYCGGLRFLSFRERASAIDQHRSLPASGGVCVCVGGALIKVLSAGGSALRSNPLPMKIPFLTKQVLLSWVFHIPSIDHQYMVPVSYTCCNCTVFKIWINLWRTFSRIFYSHKMHLLVLLGLFNDHTYSYTWSLEKASLDHEDKPDSPILVFLIKNP